MTNYIINFGIYTMAMIGFITLCAFVYKKTNTLSSLNTKSSLKIDDKIALNARKSLYVVNAGGERFLIAGDIDNTSLIARLGQENASDVDETITSLLKKPVEKIEEKVEEVQAYSSQEILPREKKFISRDTQYSTLPVFKTEVSESKKALDDAFERVEVARSGKYLDVKSIRKKPVMKELARKLAQI